MFSEQATQSFLSIITLISFFVTLIVQKISESYKEILGNQIEFINSIGVSDGRYFSADEIEIVCFGPGKDSEGHSANESIEIKSMVESALILEKSISEILGGIHSEQQET